MIFINLLKLKHFSIQVVNDYQTINERFSNVCHKKKETAKLQSLFYISNVYSTFISRIKNTILLKLSSLQRHQYCTKDLF